MKHFFRFLLLLFLSTNTFNLYSQSSGETKKLSTKQRQKQLARDKIKKGKEQKKLEEKTKKKHLKIQTKATRKRMKKSKKKSTEIKNNKRDIFIKRWINRKN